MYREVVRGEQVTGNRALILRVRIRLTRSGLTLCLQGQVVSLVMSQRMYCFLPVNTKILTFYIRSSPEWSFLQTIRPVSLTCICCKTLEHILVSKIMQHLSEHDILVESQHGFRSGRSCEIQLVQFIHDLRENLDSAHNRGHKQTYLIIMDFAKAFDKVAHRILAYKLEYYGIRNDILQWITTWLSGRTQKVVVDGVNSDPAPVLPGVPQGSVLGHILFLIFINDLDNIKSIVRIFADGCVLYRNIRRSEDRQILQDDLNILAPWEEAWLMKFNVAKCHSMRVTKHPLPKQIIHDYSLHNQVLENGPSAKYLGITITDDLDWGQHNNNVTSKVGHWVSYAETWPWLQRKPSLLHTKLWSAPN